MNEKDVCDRDLVFYDLAQAYDSLWVSHTLVDLFENKVDTNLLNIIHELSKNNKISIKTPVGISDSKEIEDTIMQGETISSILCTSTMDKVSKESPIETIKYKKEVDIPQLGFVDDVMDVKKCGKETVMMNELTRSDINERRLQFSADKCVRMHIQNKHNKNPKKCKDIYIDGWTEKVIKVESKLSKEDVHQGEISIKNVDNHLYLGDVVEKNGSNRMNVLSRAAKGQGVIRDIFQILEGTYFGSFYFEALKVMREAMLMSVITNNLEAAFNITAKDIKTLNDLNCQLL